jgi:hypothetical protein
MIRNYRKPLIMIAPKKLLKLKDVSVHFGLFALLGWL